MPDTLQIVQETIEQSSGESISYTVDTDNYPPTGVGTPSTASALVFDVSDNSNVTSTVMPSGSVSIATTIITLKPLTALTAGKTYRVEVTFTKATNVFRPYMHVRCPY